MKSLQFPECIHSYNSGYSLERWCNKKPILRCKTAPTKKIHRPEIPESSSFSLEPSKEDSDKIVIPIIPEGSFSDNDVDSDIEELFRRSQMCEDSEEIQKRDKNRRRPKKKRKSKKTIRYSWSKPVSPETEQVIRVDVTSSIPMNDLIEPSKFG